MTRSALSDSLVVLAAILLVGASHRGGTRSPGRLSLSELKSLAQWAGWTGADADHAAAIAMRESGGDANAVNDTRGKVHPNGQIDEYSIGLWQINTLSSPQWSVSWLKDARHNATAAFTLWKSAGWAPWKLTA